MPAQSNSQAPQVATKSQTGSCSPGMRAVNAVGWKNKEVIRYEKIQEEFGRINCEKIKVIFSNKSPCDEKFFKILW